MKTFTCQPHATKLVPASPVRDEPYVNLRHVLDCTDAELAQHIHDLRKVLLNPQPEGMTLSEYVEVKRWVHDLATAMEREQGRRAATAEIPEAILA